MAMLRGTPVVLSCVCALHTKGARRSCAHKNMPNTRAEVMKKRQFEWPKLSQLCDLGSASMQIRLSPNFVVLLAHGVNSTQNKFGDYAPARSGSLRLSKSTHLVHIRFQLLCVCPRAERFLRVPGLPPRLPYPSRTRTRWIRWGQPFFYFCLSL